VVVVVVATAGAAFEQLRRGYHYLGGAEALRRGGRKPSRWRAGGVGGLAAGRGPAAWCGVCGRYRVRKARPTCGRRVAGYLRTLATATGALIL